MYCHKNEIHFLLIRIETRQTIKHYYIIAWFYSLSILLDESVYIGRIIIFADFSDLHVFPQWYQVNSLLLFWESFRYSPFKLVLKHPALNHPAVLLIFAQFLLSLSLSLSLVLKYALLECLRLSPEFERKKYMYYMHQVGVKNKEFRKF